MHVVIFNLLLMYLLYNMRYLTLRVTNSSSNNRLNLFIKGNVKDRLSHDIWRFQTALGNLNT
jgi:hypothetical protein